MAASLAAPPAPSSGSRLAYLDEPSPFYVGASFPKLTTPMWFGEDGVDAVVILAVDDMRKTEPYRVFLDPILSRLREIEGRSPLSIFTCEMDPTDPQLQRWLEAGVRFDVHTRTHPCPLLRPPFASAASEMLDCVTNLNSIPGNRPVAFRMPCCDSINSASPRFFSEILPLRTRDGQFLEADSSVLMFLDDSYKPYAPFKNYAATAERYPYPFVIDRLIWEFPIICPSDWQAQNRQQPFNPQTVADIERGIDLVVEAQGTFTLCFHPHGWLRNTQIVEIIDHAVKRHGRGVRFLNFHDALARLTRNLLGGVPLRAADGSDNGVRLLDLDADGYLDVVIGNDERQETRLWSPKESRWIVGPFPFRIVTRSGGDLTRETGVKFAILEPNGFASALAPDDAGGGLAHFDGRRWIPAGRSPLAEFGAGARFRDVDGDGLSDLLVSDASRNVALRWDAGKSAFTPLPFALPRPASLASTTGTTGTTGAARTDRGLRFWDVNRDGHDDVVLSNEDEYYVYLWDGPERGWARRVLEGRAGGIGALPVIASEGHDMGAWIHDNVMYVANEETAKLPDLVETRSFDRMIEHMESPPVEPADALKLFRVPDGFRVELFASEPMVTDPVAIDFGLDGRVWVVEMGTYPLGAGPGGSVTGRVKLLRDRDGDGRADAASVFADGFSFPTGVLSHGRGVLVTCAPDIVYLEDTDGDDRADVRRVVFSGFGEGNQQHRVNGLHHGIDNWIYGANGESGGEITLDGAPGARPVSIRGRDFRFSQDLRVFEATTGHTQFGLAMDDAGNRFGASNARHLMHSVLPERYLARNPHHAPPDPVLDIPDHGAMARIYATSKELISLNDIHVPGHFSSACGVAIYRGAAFPDEYRGCAYECEPVANLVHRDVLVPDGATFRAERAPAEKTSELLTSSDNWFRPVFCANGPDGCLYVVDMYRYVIEHPAYIPKDLQDILDFTAGQDRGRIYRIAYGASAAPAAPRHHDVTRESTKDLVALLEDPNGWWRDAAQRLLVERQDASAVPPLESICRSAASPIARLHALWTLEGLGSLRDEIVLDGLRSGSPTVCEHALRLAEPRLTRSPELLAAAVALAKDESFRVRLQAVFTLGESTALEASEALARILRRDVDDRWMRAAVLSSSLHHAGRLLAWMLTGSQTDERPSLESAAWREVFAGLLATVTRSGDVAQLQDILEQPGAGSAADRWRIVVLAELADAGLDGGGADGAAPAGVTRLRAVARQASLDSARPPEERIEAVRALGLSIAGETGARLLEPREAPDVQLATVRALRRAYSRGVEAASRALIDAWPGAGPLVRAEILESLLATEKGTGVLLDAVESEKVLAREVDAQARARILATKDGAIRERASRLLPASSSGDRERMVLEYRRAVKDIPRDVARGRGVFEKSCATCHRVDGTGFEVGPDLGEARAKGDDALLEAILNPSRMIPPRFMPYAVETPLGVSLGIIANETAAGITLRRSGGVEEKILRADIVRLTAQSESLMPAGLEQTISPAGMADLLAFLAAVPRPLDSLTAAEMDAARREALASSLGGLAEVLRSSGEEEQASWVGRVRMRYARQLDDRQELEWKTEPVPAALDRGARHAFVFPGAMGYVSQPSGFFTLSLGGTKLLRFDVRLDSSAWKSDDGAVTLRYSARARNAEDSTGLFTLDVPASLLEPGKPATLRVTGSASGSRRWFGLLPLR